MCIVILKDKHGEVSKDHLQNSFDNNPDGAGYLFANNGLITLKKGFFKFLEFWESFSRDMIEMNNPISIIHFRIKTHGATNKMNCHPFLINDGLGFAHNGIIDFVNDHKKKSDTLIFRNDILNNLPEGFIFNTAIMELITEAIGTSKLVFLNGNGDYRIVNQKMGHWSNDGLVWYSNDSYSFYGYSSYYGHYAYKDYLSIGAKKKKKKKKKSNNIFEDFEYLNCRTCNTNLTSLPERKIGHCDRCYGDHPRKV